VLLRAKLISSYPKTIVATLTGLTDARSPVSGGALQTSAAASPTAGASPVAGNALGAGSTGALESAASGTGTSGAGTGSAGTGAAGSTAVSPAAASEAIARTAASGSIAGTPQTQFVDLVTAPHADVLAVQSGRVVKLGHSRALGRYLVLRDVYGDIFTYAGLGSIASSYRPGSSHSS